MGTINLKTNVVKVNEKILFKQQGVLKNITVRLTLKYDIKTNYHR